jgi:hypothetical protein
MENKSVVLLFFVMIVLFVLAFTLSLDAVSQSQVLYGVYAFVGFLLMVLVSLYQSMILGKDGSSVAYWFRGLSLVSLVVLVWYSTRLGTLFGWW